MFVSASYVRRLLHRTGIYDSDDYETTRSFLESSLHPDPSMYAHFYGLMVHHCQVRCRSEPVCDGCPLSTDCPSSDDQ